MGYWSVETAIAMIKGGDNMKVTENTTNAKGKKENSRSNQIEQ